ALLRSVTSASNRFNGFLQANAPNIITLSRASVPTLRLLQRYSPEFPCLSHTLTQFIPVMDHALGKGTNQPGLHAILKVVPARARHTAPALTLRASTPPAGPTARTSCPGRPTRSRRCLVSTVWGPPTRHRRTRSSPRSRRRARIPPPRLSRSGAACCSDRYYA